MIRVVAVFIRCSISWLSIEFFSIKLTFSIIAQTLIMTLSLGENIMNFFSNSAMSGLKAIEYFNSYTTN